MTAIRPPRARSTAALGLAIALLAPAAPAPAAFVAGEQLLAHCRAKNRLNVSYCMGYLSGVLDAMKSGAVTQIGSTGEALNSRRIDPPVCFPKDLTLEQIRDHFITWASRHDDDLQLAAAQTVRRAVRDLWPCDRNA